MKNFFIFNDKKRYIPFFDNLLQIKLISKIRMLLNFLRQEKKILFFGLRKKN